MSIGVCPVTLLSALRDGASRHAEHYGVALTKASALDQACMMRFMQLVQDAKEAFAHALLIGDTQGIHGATASLFEVLALEPIERISTCCAAWAHYARTERQGFEQLVDSAYVRLYDSPSLVDELQQQWHPMAKA